jgi:arylsulfatase A-like enzyme
VSLLFSRALPFWVCGSAAWAGLLALDITAERAEAPLYVARTQYLIELACSYSSLFLAPLIALHSLRCLWLRWSPRPDRWLSLALAALLAAPSYRCANLLSSGSMLFDAALRARTLVFVSIGLLGGCIALWHVHLALVGAPRHWLGDVLDRRYAHVRGPLSLLTCAIGAAILVGTADLVSRELRAYLFLSEFLLPAAFLFAASLLYGLQRRAAPRLSVLLAVAIAIGLCTGQGNQNALHRAKAFFERRAGLIALTDLAVGSERGAPDANIDISHPERFQCHPEPEPPFTPVAKDELAKHRNVILISVDTLRKDALSTKGANGPIAPTLQRIAKQSVSFERAVTTYPATLFAISSALTGESPSEVMFAPQPPANLFTRTASRFQEQNIVLPQAGWFKRSPIPELFTQLVKPRFFDEATAATSHVIQRLRGARARKRTSFTWLHYYDPHTTHVERGSNAERSARQSYAALVRGVDREIGRLWSELERLDYLSDSLIIVFSDHGEALGEFGYFGHHVYLNHFATDVPLIVHAPGVKPARVSQLALLSDISATVLAWLNLPNDARDARDLLSLHSDHTERYGVSEAFPVRGRTLYDVARSPIRSTSELSERLERLRTAAIDYQPKVSLVSSHYRLIVNRVTGTEELYDRVKDRQERDDLATRKLKVHKRMRTALADIMRERSERIYCRVKRP